MVCSLPRYIDQEGKAKVIEVEFADKNKGYTHLFSQKIIECLQAVKVQKTVAEWLQTTAHIARSVMDNSVEKTLEKREIIQGFKNISLDEKAYTNFNCLFSILKSIA